MAVPTFGLEPDPHRPDLEIRHQVPTPNRGKEEEDRLSWQPVPTSLSGSLSRSLKVTHVLSLVHWPFWIVVVGSEMRDS